MTNSRLSRSQRSSWFCWLVALAVLLGVFVTGSAEAGARRKRIAVLDFEGPKAKVFHAAVVKLIKRRHTVIASDAWDRAAEDLEADKVTEKNIRLVAKKLKVDGVVTGTIEKRRNDYIVRLKLKAGASGELVGHRVDVKVRGTKLNAKAQREIKDELIAAIDELDQVEDSDRSSDGDSDNGDTSGETKNDPGKAETEERGSGGKRRTGEPSRDADDESAELPKNKSVPAHSSNDEQTGSDSAPKRRGDDQDQRPNGEALTPTNRAIDVAVGMSFSMRRLQFSADADLANVPPSYRQRGPVAGGVVDAIVYPLAVGHRRRGILPGLGLELAYDRVIRIRSQRQYLDEMNNKQVADLPTTQDRFSIGAVVRYPFTPRFVLGAKVLYSRQQFEIAQQLPNGSPTDLPSVQYSMLEPKFFALFALTSAIAIHAEGGAMFVTDSGPIANPMTGYGSTSGSGFELSAGLDVHLTRTIFVRILGRLQRFSLSFKGDANSLATSRDNDPQQDVQGATDQYYGGAATLGFAY